MRYASLRPVLFVIFLLATIAAKADAGIKTATRGDGPAMVFIPGLNSGPETFADTCTAFEANYTCHLLHLPGFAGNAPLADVGEGFLSAMRDDISHYLQANELRDVVLIGHSLGGVLSLMVAQAEPDRIRAMVIVDALPFYPAIQNPAADVAQMRPIADQMKAAMLRQSPEQYQQRAAMQLNGMSNDPSRMATLLAWTKSSDPATTAQAMYDMYTIDLRDTVANINTPTLILGSWAAYKAYGSTKASTKAIFEAQYALMPNKTIRMSETGYHFLTWDEPTWVAEEIAAFLQRNQP